MKEHEKIKIGISSCLLGNPVRFDGGHKRDRYITDTLGLYFEFVPVCPEVECGLPVPRESMRLVGDPAEPRLMSNKSGTDHTDRMLEWCERGSAVASQSYGTHSPHRSTPTRLYGGAAILP